MVNVVCLSRSSQRVIEVNCVIFGIPQGGLIS